jgi:hypothetical protein
MSKIYMADADIVYTVFSRLKLRTSKYREKDKTNEEIKIYFFLQ